MKENIVRKMSVMMDNVDLLLSSLKILPSDKLNEVLAVIEEKCEAKAVITYSEANFSRAALKVEMQSHDADGTAIDSSVDASNDELDKMMDDIEDEIDIVVEGDGKITKISSDELVSGNLYSHVNVVHKLEDFTVGKRGKIF